MDEGLYLRAARSIRLSQFVHFESMRLSSQPDGAMQTNDLSLAGALGVTNAEGGQSFTQDIKVKDGDDEERQKSVSVDGEVLVIESKSKSGLGMRSKRSIISTVGLPITFVNALAISVPSRLSDITFTFSDSVSRDLFAYKLFLYSKGHYNFESNFGIESVRGSSMLNQNEPNIVRSDSFRSVLWELFECRELMCYVQLAALDLFYNFIGIVHSPDRFVSMRGAGSEKKTLYKQGFLNKQVKIAGVCVKNCFIELK
jgi:hypothetical protein